MRDTDNVMGSIDQYSNFLCNNNLPVLYSHYYFFLNSHGGQVRGSKTVVNVPQVVTESSYSSATVPKRPNEHVT